MHSGNRDLFTILPFHRFSPFLLYSFLLAARGKACRILLLVLTSLIEHRGIKPKGITRTVCAIHITRIFGKLKFDESVANMRIEKCILATLSSFFASTFGRADASNRLHASKLSFMRLAGGD